MSYDLHIWSISKPSWREVLPDFERWQAAGAGMLLQRGKWQIVAGPVSEVLPEDIPVDIMAKLPGIRYLIELNLEPLHAPSSARQLLARVARNISRAGPGVIQDPQADTLTTPRGVVRLQRQTQPPRISLLTFSWWFTEGPLSGERGYRGLLSLFERYLPEALPRRYGEYEPPQFQFEETGQDHFLDLLSRTTLSLVWYPHYPVLSLYLGVFGTLGPTRQGYRANYLSIGVDSSVLDQPGWRLALERFWVAASKFVRPFYGDGRLLDNYLFRRGRIFIDHQTEQHPVINGWWNGIPRQLGQAVVLGEPYLSHWPGFVKRAGADGSLYFLSVGAWSSEATVQQMLGGRAGRFGPGQHRRSAEGDRETKLSLHLAL
jgi:hypothetical protein